MTGQQQKSAKGGAPVSSHPAFPAIVGLWFAALFGIGMLVVPASLLEQVSVAIGLPAIVESAAPPLGFTARAMLALGAACVGLAIGLWVSRKVAAAQAAPSSRSRDLNLKQEDRHPDAPAKRPISARRELGGEGLGRASDTVADPWKFDDEWADDDDYADSYGYDEDEQDYEDDSEDGDDRDDDDDGFAPNARVATPLPGRRRALAVTDDSGPSDFLPTVPLPGEADASSHPLVDDEPLELDVLEEEADDAIVAADEVAQPPVPEPGMDEPPALEAPAEPAAHVFATSMVQEDQMMEPRQTDAAATAPVGALAELGTAELVERFARALKERRERTDPLAETAPAAPSATGIPDGANPFADRAAELDQFVGAEAFAPAGVSAISAAVPDAAVSSRDPGSVEAEPVAAASGVAAQTSDPAPMVFRRSGQSDISASEPAPVPQMHAFDQPRAVPSALQPVGFDDQDEDEDDGLPLSLDLSAGRAFAGPTDGFSAQPAGEEPSTPAAFAPPVPEEEESHEQGDEDAYSSLLSMKNKFAGHQFARVEDEDAGHGHYAPEPVVVFPGQEGRPAQDFSRPAEPVDTSPAAIPQSYDSRADETRPFDAPGDGAPARSAATPHANATETERALREALEKLQRMSGAA